MNKPDLVCITAAQLLGSRARHGYDPKSPELVSEAVDQAELIIAEIEKRLEAEAEASAAAAAPTPPSAPTTPVAPAAAAAPTPPPAPASDSATVVTPPAP